MSRGPGRVMREVLAQLDRGALTTPALVQRVRAYPQAVHRALQVLEKNRFVVRQPGRPLRWALAKPTKLPENLRYKMKYRSTRKPTHRDEYPEQLEAPLVGNLFDMHAAVGRVEAWLAELDRQESLQSLGELDALRAEFDRLEAENGPEIDCEDSAD